MKSAVISLQSWLLFHVALSDKLNTSISGPNLNQVPQLLLPYSIDVYVVVPLFNALRPSDAYMRQ